jgi:hypothetical protein
VRREQHQISNTSSLYMPSNAHDSGYVQTTSGLFNVSPKSYFSTQIKKPNMLRFEFRDRLFEDSDEDVTTIWSDGQTILQKDDAQNISQIFDLAVPTSGSLTISKDFAPPVSALLIDSVLGPKFTSLPSASYVGSETINGEECHCLKNLWLGRVAPREVDIWLSKSRLLLIKTRETLILDPVRMDLSGLEPPDTSDLIETEIKVEAMRRVLAEFFKKGCGRSTDEWKIKAMRSIELEIITQVTVYTSVVLNKDLESAVFRH